MIGNIVVKVSHSNALLLRFNVVTAGTVLNTPFSKTEILLFCKFKMRKLFKPSNARSEMRCQ